MFHSCAIYSFPSMFRVFCDREWKTAVVVILSEHANGKHLFKFIHKIRNWKNHQIEPNRLPYLSDFITFEINVKTFVLIKTTFHTKFRRQSALSLTLSLSPGFCNSHTIIMIRDSWSNIMCYTIRYSFIVIPSEIQTSFCLQWNNSQLIHILHTHNDLKTFNLNR